MRYQTGQLVLCTLHIARGYGNIGRIIICCVKRRRSHQRVHLNNGRLPLLRKYTRVKLAIEKKPPNST